MSSRPELNRSLKQHITVIDIDDKSNWIPLAWALYSVYLKDKVIRIDLTRKGYHIIIYGNYPNLQLLFSADTNLNATKRLFIVKKRRGKKRVHDVFFPTFSDYIFE